MNTAQLAATDFTAGMLYLFSSIFCDDLNQALEKQNITIIQTPSASASSAHNPFLLTDREEKEALEKHRQNKSRLRVPRRAPWKKGMTHAQIERQEKDAFLEWRRGLAQY